MSNVATAKTSKAVATRGRGRPVVYGGALAAAIVKIIGKNGLTVAQTIINTEGVQFGKPGVKTEDFETFTGLISLPTLLKLKDAHNRKIEAAAAATGKTPKGVIKLTRGRKPTEKPATVTAPAAVAAPEVPADAETKAA